MSSKLLRWQEVPQRYGSPEYHLYCGNIAVGSAGWNNSRSRGDGPDNQHRWHLNLPGKPRKGVSETLDAAKVAAECAFADWCVKAHLVPAD